LSFNITIDNNHSNISWYSKKFRNSKSVGCPMNINPKALLINVMSFRINII
jgi:hypothetical protein